MTTIRWGWFIPLLLLCAARTAGAADSFAIMTWDGLSLSFDDGGRLRGIALDGVALPGAPAAGGFFVSEITAADAPLPMNGASREGVPVTGTVSRTGDDELTVSGELPSQGLRFTGVIQGGAALRIRAQVENTRGGDRAFIVSFRVPIDGGGWRWSTALESSRGLASGDRVCDAFNWFQAYRTTTSASPIATLTRESEGLALAIPPTAPAIYRLSYDGPRGFQVEWELGTAPEPTRFPNAARVEALLYRVDPRWGYRSALKRMYLLHPSLWVKRAMDGSWIYTNQPSSIPAPEDFAIRFNETYSWADDFTRAHGIYALKYVEPWNDHLERDPAGLFDWAADTAANQAWAQISKGQPRQIAAQSALLSGVIGRDGEFAGFSDPANFTDPEGTRRYVLNPDREIPNFMGFTANATDVKRVLNRGQSVEEYELFRQWGRNPGAGEGYDGLYLDSTNTSGSGWAGWHLFNFRREHFATTRVPLVFDPQSGKVALSQALSSVEAIRQLSEIVHERGGRVMANGMPDPFLFSTAAFCDFVSPGEGYDGSFTRMRAMRAALYDKPTSFIFNAQVTDAQFQHAMLYAVFPGGAGLEGNRAVYKRWAPTMLRVGAAGWEPLTFARTDDPSVLVERFGSLERGDLLFVVHREGGRAGAARLTLDRLELGLGEGVRVAATEVATSTGLAVEEAGGALAIPLQLGPEQTQIIAVSAAAGVPGPTAGELLPSPPRSEPRPAQESGSGPESEGSGAVEQRRRGGCAIAGGPAGGIVLLGLASLAIRSRRRRTMRR